MILYFSGTDGYRISKKIKDIKEKFKTEVDPNGINIVELDSPQPGNLRQEIFSSAFLAKRKLIIVKNIFSGKLPKGMDEVLEELLEKDSSAADSNIIAISDSYLEERKKPTILQKKFKATKFAQEFLKPKPFEMPGYILNEVAQRKGEISRSDAEYLASLIGTDTILVDNELQKLLSLSPQITRSNIENLTSTQFQDDIFILIDAISSGNKQKALSLIEDFFSLGNDEHFLISMMIRQCKILLQIKSLTETNPRISSEDIAQKLSIHPYVAKKTLPQTKPFSNEQLKEIFAKLSEMDFQLKTSFADPTLLIDRLIVTMEKTKNGF